VLPVPQKGIGDIQNNLDFQTHTKQSGFPDNLDYLSPHTDWMTEGVLYIFV